MILLILCGLLSICLICRSSFGLPSILTQGSYPSREKLLNELFPEGETQKARIFMCYGRDLEPDQTVALRVSQALSQQYDVFFDQATSGNPDWAERINKELERTDFLIAFLSAASIADEVVSLELEMAYTRAEAQDGFPLILPVRLAYREPFQEPLSTYLDSCNWAFWQNEADTPRLIEELNRALSGGSLPIDEQAKMALIRESEPAKLPLPRPVAQPEHLEKPEGAIDPQSIFYVEREGDQVALETIRGQGATITIKGSRQMGKSSLLIRIGEAAKKAGKQVAFLDFQLLKSSCADADTFVRHFCSLLTIRLELDNQVEAYWSLPLPEMVRCTEYVSTHLLKALDRPLVLAIDEADIIFGTDFRTDFFGMLRSWHNKRAHEPIWKQLDLTLVTSTEPYYFISDLNQSPFNVGEVIELQDFSAKQVADLNHRHGSPLTSEQEAQLMDLLKGHPYLVRRALYLVASQRLSAKELFAQTTDDRGPFGDHLRSLLLRLYNRPDLLQGLQQVMSDQTCHDKEVFFRLRGAGLVYEDKNRVFPRCQLYADFFQEHLDG